MIRSDPSVELFKEHLKTYTLGCELGDRNVCVCGVGGYSISILSWISFRTIQHLKICTGSSHLTKSCFN